MGRCAGFAASVWCSWSSRCSPWPGSRRASRSRPRSCCRTCSTPVRAAEPVQRGRRFATAFAVPRRRGRGREPDLAELWLPAWASAERPAGAILLVLGVNNVGRNHPAVERVADGAGPHRRGRARPRLADAAGGPPRGRRDRRRRARVPAPRRAPRGRPRPHRDLRLQRRWLAGAARRARPSHRRRGPLGERRSAPSPTRAPTWRRSSAHAYRGRGWRARGVGADAAGPRGLPALHAGPGADDDRPAALEGAFGATHPRRASGPRPTPGLRESLGRTPRAPCTTS